MLHNRGTTSIYRFFTSGLRHRLTMPYRCNGRPRRNLLTECSMRSSRNVFGLNQHCCLAPPDSSLKVFSSLLLSGQHLLWLLYHLRRNLSTAKIKYFIAELYFYYGYIFVAGILRFCILIDKK